jgi:hypothetical protein
MDHLRKWIYALGVRPKPGSIFYSPSRDFTLSSFQLSAIWLDEYAEMAAKVQTLLESDGLKSDKIFFINKTPTTSSEENDNA